MSKKDYIKFAEMIKARRTHIENVTSENMKQSNPDLDKQIALDAQFYEVSYYAKSIADLFAADNPNFDRDRFLKACRVE